MCITVNPTTVQNKTVLIYLNCENGRAIFGYKAPEFTNKSGHQINYLVFLLPTTSKITPIDVKETNLLKIINNKIFYLSGNIGIMFHSENYEDSSKNIYYDNSTHQLKKYILFARHPDEKIWVDYVETKYDLEGVILEKQYDTF